MTGRFVWPPAIGGVIGLERAAAILAVRAADIRRVGRQTVDEILSHEPGISEADIERKMVPASALARNPNDGHTTGCVVAVVSWLSRGGSTIVVGINISWADASVYRTRFPWEQ